MSANTRPSQPAPSANWAVMPAIPEKFAFTVRDADIADQINASIGKKVVLEYQQHKGLPSCFGDTEHFVTKVTPLNEE